MKNVNSMRFFVPYINIIQLNKFITSDEYNYIFSGLTDATIIHEGHFSSDIPCIDSGSHDSILIKFLGDVNEIERTFKQIVI